MSKLNCEIEATYKVVKKLTGLIDPVGETRADEDRFENLQILCGVLDKLLFDIDAVARLNKERVEYSMSRSGIFASQFLKSVSGELDHGSH